jgi:hypothetical protein
MLMKYPFERDWTFVLVGCALGMVLGALGLV